MCVTLGGSIASAAWLKASLAFSQEVQKAPDLDVDELRFDGTRLVFVHYARCVCDHLSHAGDCHGNQA